MGRVTLLFVVFLFFSISSANAGLFWELKFPNEVLLGNELDDVYEFDEPEIPFITGGSEATEGEFPWQVSLQKGAGRHFCGGSILDETHIITACHCIDGQAASSILVVAGAHNMKDSNESSQQIIGAKKLVGNPEYSRYFRGLPKMLHKPPISESSLQARRINFDSAIIHLLEPLVFNERVQPIRLPPPEHEPSGECTTSGWGNANRLGIRPVWIPDSLQKLNMSVMPRGLCRIPYLFGTRSWLTVNMVCTRNGFVKGTCNGDSGGPLICYDLPDDPEPYLAGLTSFGVPPCGNLFFPSVFANVASQRKFIDEELASSGDTPDPPARKGIFCTLFSWC